MTDDADLLKRYAREGSQEAFTEFVRRHLNLVYSVALRRTGGDAHLAEDVVQAVFTSAARKAQELSRHATITGWLFTSTRYAAAAAARGNERRKRREKEAQVMEDLLRPDASKTDWEKFRPLLDELLETLPKRDREAVLLRFYDGCSYADVGAKLRLSDDAARMRVDRALARLADLLARRGVPSSAAALTLVFAHQAVAAPSGLAVSAAGAAMLSASVAVSPGVALLQFMTTTKMTTALAAVILATAATLATREVRASRDADIALAAATRDYAVVESSLQTLQQRAAATDQKVNAALAAIDTMKAGSAVDAENSADASARKRAAARPAVDPVQAGKAFLERHPEVKQALLARAHAHIASQYGHFYAQWRLSPEKIQQFEALMMENEGVGAALDEGNGTMFLNPGTGMARDEVDRRVHALLGEDAYAGYRETKDLTPVRQMVMDMASSLYYTDAPLAPEQIQQLNQIIVDARKSPLPSALRWSAALAKAKTVLKPEQESAANDVLTKRDFDRALTEAMKPKSPAPSKPSS